MSVLESSTNPGITICIPRTPSSSSAPLNTTAVHRPVYRARLDHAYDLFQHGIAPVVITTGGFADDPRFSEGGVGHDYLMHRGIPEASLIAETTGSDTSESAQRVAVIMRANHLHTCVAVSDAYHVFRIRKLLKHEGMQVQAAPRPDSSSALRMAAGSRIAARVGELFALAVAPHDVEVFS